MDDSWNRALDTLVAGPLDTIARGDDRIETYCEDTMMRGDPDLVVRARDECDVREVMAHCDAHGIPLTFCASQTSMTGASVARGGVLLSTERLEGVVNIRKTDGGAEVVVRPGTVTADLQRAVADAGWFFPVAPTSRDECRIGANVATNASGEDSYKYGPIRRYVRRLRIVTPSGEERILERAPADTYSLSPMRGGYETAWTNPLDLVIGSEGTLAFVAEVVLALLPAAPPFYSMLAPFERNDAALRFIIDTVSRGQQGIRALELIDNGALAAMRTADGIAPIPDNVAAMVYLKQEYDGDDAMASSLEGWYERVAAAAGQTCADAILIAETDKQKEDFRLWRHRVPEWANEQGRALRPAGGGKVGSDWWVPVERLVEMMDYFYGMAQASGMTHMAYAHLGRGHPHTNLLARDAREHERAHEILVACCRKAVELGGGVAGEHGVGKLHTDLLTLQHTHETIERMKRWKREYDPRWILGRGTIFE